MRYVTFYYDLLRESECHKWFELNTKFKATKLPATYGYPMRKYYGVSVRTFKKMFGVSVDEAMGIAQGRK